MLLSDKMPHISICVYINMSFLLLLYWARFVIKIALWSVQIYKWPDGEQTKNANRKCMIFFFRVCYISSILCNCVYMLYIPHVHSLTHTYMCTDNFHFLFDFLMISAIKSSALFVYRKHHSNFMKNELNFSRNVFFFVFFCPRWAYTCITFAIDLNNLLWIL